MTIELACRQCRAPFTVERRDLLRGPVTHCPACRPASVPPPDDARGRCVRCGEPLPANRRGMCSACARGAPAL